MHTKPVQCCTPNSVATGLILEAMGADAVYDQVRAIGLPDHAIQVPERDAIIAATSAPAPLFRTGIEQVASARRLDVILLRVGPIVDGVMTVSVDFALASLPCATWVEHDFAPWADHRSLWLVPPGFGPAVSLGWEGASLEISPPYSCLGERADGIARAGRDLARLVQPERVR